MLSLSHQLIQLIVLLFHWLNFGEFCFSVEIYTMQGFYFNYTSINQRISCLLSSSLPFSLPLTLQPMISSFFMFFIAFAFELFIVHKSSIEKWRRDNRIRAANAINSPVTYVSLFVQITFLSTLQFSIFHQKIIWLNIVKVCKRNFLLFICSKLVVQRESWNWNQRVYNYLEGLSKVK